MFYTARGSVYFVDAQGVAHGVDVTTRDKVEVKRTTLSVGYSVHEEAVALPAGAVPCTVERAAARFGVTEDEPLLFDGGGAGPAYEAMTRAELFALCDERGVEVGRKATKAELCAALSEAR